VTRLTFSDTGTASRVCRYSANHSNVHSEYCVDGSIRHFESPKVVQAHTSGELGNLYSFLLRVYSWTFLPIFIEIGSCLTDPE